jgi:hypothetical protein
MASRRRHCHASGTGAGAQLDTRSAASSGHPRCREPATCVPGPGHCEPPDGRRDNSSERGSGVRSQAAHSSPADRTREGKKSFCCVTTRRRNLQLLNGLGHSLGPLTALALCLGVPSFGVSLLAMFGLPPRCLPAADLPPAFRLLAVALVPTPRLVLAAAPFAQAAPWARSPPSGRAVRLSLIVEGAHGRFDLPREKLGEDVSAFSSGVFKNANKTVTRQSKAFEAKKTKNKTDLKARPGRRREDRGLVSWRSPTAQKRR